VFGTEGRTVEVITLADRGQAGEPDLMNSFKDPDRVTTRMTTFPAASARFGYQFPALSRTVLQYR
jgi:hypothetical protein